MPIVDKRQELERFDSFPTLCIQCGLGMTIPKPSAQVLDALYKVSLLRDLGYELRMLQRTQALFERFPNSRHPQKMCKEFPTKEERPKMESDPELDSALNVAPELKAFLRNSFWLPGRLRFVQELMELQEQPNLSLIKCTKCGDGHFCIEPDFLANVLWL